MTCPICDQKPMNCDCTKTEKRQWSEIEDLRLTDEEREAIEVAIRCVDSVRSWKAPQDALREKMIEHAATLRGLLERLG